MKYPAGKADKVKLTTRILLVSGKKLNVLEVLTSPHAFTNCIKINMFLTAAGNLRVSKHTGTQE